MPEESKPENNQESPVKLVTDFISMLRKAAFYPASHPAVTSCVDGFYQGILYLLSSKDSLTLEISADNKIFIDKEEVKLKNISIQENVDYLRKSGIENLTFSQGLSKEEVGEFLKALVSLAQSKVKTEINKLLEEKHITHIQSNQFSYVRIKKDEEVIVGKPDDEVFKSLKAKLADLAQAKNVSPEDSAGLEKNIFGLAVNDFKEKNELSLPLKSVLKKFLSVCADMPAAISKLKGAMLEEDKITPEAVEAFIEKLQDDLSAKAQPKKRHSTKEYEQLIKENQELKEKLTKLESDLRSKEEILKTLPSAGVPEGVAPQSDSPGKIPFVDGEKLTKENLELKNILADLEKQFHEKADLLKHIEKETVVLSQETQALESIIHHLTEGVVVIDAHGKLLMINEAAGTLLGADKEATGKFIKDIIKKEHLLTLTKKISSQDSKGASKDIELYSPDEGTMHTLISSSAVVEDHNGRAVGMITVLQDVAKLNGITKQNMDFFAKVTHELRSPLIAMDKSLGLVVDKTAGPLNPDQENFLGTIQRNARRLMLLVNDLLDLAKFEARKIQLIIEPVSLDKVIDEPTASFKSWADTKSITIEKNIQEGLPRASIDANRIIQVVNNLISNAIKFTPAGGKILVGVIRKDDLSLELSVKDSGPGIPPEALARIFEKFYQVQPGSGGEFRGTGIGLALSKEIVELHGGTISLESKPGEGTRFFFTLPIAK